MVATFYSAPNSMVKVNIGRRLLLLADLKRIVISLSPSCLWVRLPQSHTSHIDLTILCPGSPDGSLSSLTPVEEHAYKRLQLLQGQLTRNIQHTAALNPKAFRYGSPVSDGHQPLILELLYLGLSVMTLCLSPYPKAFWTGTFSHITKHFQSLGRMR